MDQEAKTSPDGPVQKLPLQACVLCRRRVRILVIFIGGIFVLTIFVLYLPPHWQQIVLGTIAFIVGSALLIWTEERKKRKWLKLMKAVIVPIVLASGGLLTTHGWNIRDQYHQDQALIISIARDWKLNDTRIKYISTYRDGVRASDYELMTMFPSFTTDNISRAMTFKRFDPSHGGRFAKSLFRYVHAAEIIAAHFLIINSTQASLIPWSDNKGKQTIFEEIFKEGALYDAFVQEHQAIHDFMSLNYPWIFDRLDNIDTLQEFYFWDPNSPYKMQKYIDIQEAKRKKANKSADKKADNKP